MFGQFHRVLRPGGPLLLGFHVGSNSRLKTHGYGGHPMKVYIHRRQPARVAAWLRDAGFTVEEEQPTTVDRSTAPSAAAPVPGDLELIAAEIGDQLPCAT